MWRLEVSIVLFSVVYFIGGQQTVSGCHSLAVEMYHTYQTPVKTKGIHFSILRFFPLLYSQVENKQSGSKAGPCAPVIDELL